MQTLEAWLQHWLGQHTQEIVMGLERVRAVWIRLGAPRVATRIISIAGTNGKGSTVAFIDSILRAHGLRVGRFTSPHLLRYNERIVVQNLEASDQALIAAFERIEGARGDIPLTYFEAGTLAALLIFAQSTLDVVILEVGLGGRLDAVNIVDADVAVISSIALDHQDILGRSLDAIAFEKSGICRAAKPAVIAMRSPSAALMSAIQAQQALPIRAGHEFDWTYEAGASHWTLQAGATRFNLPLPPLHAPIQMQNAAAAVMAVMQCPDLLVLEADKLSQGIENTALRGRLQCLGQNPERWIDVAHNAEAAQVLAQWLGRQSGTTHVVFSALADKDIVEIVAAMPTQGLRWYLCGLDALTPRGLSAPQLQVRLASVLDASTVEYFDAPAAAWRAAMARTAAGERVLAFGSFFLLSELLALEAMV